MNDLMPPPRRPLPGRDRERIRDVLETRANTVDAPMRRFVTPWLAAAAVAAIAVGGYGLATTLGGDGGSGDVIAPAGGTDSTAPPDSSSEPSTPPQGTPTGPSGSVPPVASMAPDEAYDRCIGLVRRWARLMGETVGSPEGRVVASSGTTITAVVSDGTSAWTCNLVPDTALSHEVPDSPPADLDASTFAFAFNVASNFGDYPGDLAWAGGVLPQGVTEITYVFPDGHAEPASTKDGYWVMQYLSEEPWGRNINKTDPVHVQLRGPAGEQTVTVPLDSDTICNQVTHGC